MKKAHFTLIAKLLVVGCLLYFLSQKGFISLDAIQRAFSNWQHMAPAILASILTTFLGVLRWHWLLHGQGIYLPWRRTLQLAFVGNFFNIALPGAISGDLIKAFYVAKETDVQRGRTFGTIIFDRVAGLSALVLVSAGALLYGISTFWGTPLMQAIQFFVGAAALAVIGFFAYLFLMKEDRDPLLLIFRKLEGKVKRAGSFTRIYEGIRFYHNDRGLLIRTLAISILIQILIPFICWEFAMALGEVHLSILSLFAIVPLGILVTAVPVAPAGVGTGHAAFLALFHLVGSQRGADVFSLYAMMTLAIGAVGGIVYLRFRSNEALDLRPQPEN